jgi:acetoin utilization deacetylase AcuC-like enzyme
VALLDFDVHHGNGTRACVSNTAPGKLQVPFSTPMSEGVHIYNTYQPWFDTDDDDNILFASVQGYGPKSSARPGGCAVGAGPHHWGSGDSMVLLQLFL